MKKWIPGDDEEMDIGWKLILRSLCRSGCRDCDVRVDIERLRCREVTTEK